MTTIYIDEERGVDAFLKHGADNEYRVKKKGDEDLKPATKAALKKVVNYTEAQRKKREAAAKRVEKKGQETVAAEAALAAAQNIHIAEDPSLSKATLIDMGETDPKVIGRLRKSQDEPPQEGAFRRVRVQSRVYRVAKQGGLMFVTLRRGLSLMQCLLSGQLAKTYDALTLTRETSMEISGELWEVRPGLHAPLGPELHAEYFRIIAKAPGGDWSFTNRVPKMAAAVILVRDALENAFRVAYRERNIKKVSLPALVQTQVEGGGPLFAFDYYGEAAFLTQSSQLYLETVLPSLGDVYCIEKSFRAEKSLTRRHHIICRVIGLVLEDPSASDCIKKYNPEFTRPARTFLRMRYSDAINWLRARGIQTPEGKDHVFGDGIAEAAERKMTDEINRPILLTHFPVALKAVYMQPDSEGPRVTESVDLLMPGVGEVVGGSMRIWDHDALLAAYKHEGIDPAGYYGYID